MKKAAKIYIISVSLAGLLLGVLCCLYYVRQSILSPKGFSLPMIFIPVLVCAVCRSFPISIRDNEVLDLSVISVLAVYLTQGAPAAVTTYMLSSFITLDSNVEDKKIRHIFKLGPQKLCFNDATIILSIVLPAVLIRIVSRWTPGDISLPTALLPTMLFSLLTFVVNGILQMTMFCINGMIAPADMAHMMLGLTPNVIAAMPMGLVIALGYSSESKIWVVFLMLLPLLLARYAWKLYLDSEKARSTLVAAFIRSIEAKDKYTQGHSERVAEYALQIAHQMRLGRRRELIIHKGAVLHDIGKIGISDSILNKPDRLDDAELEIMATHPQLGEKILKEVGIEKEALEMVLSHHERIDGTGYPNGIRGAELSLGTRILCVADAYDAMTSDRPYRLGMPMEEAIGILLEGKGSQFDPEVVDAFVAVLEKK